MNWYFVFITSIIVFTLPATSLYGGRGLVKKLTLMLPLLIDEIKLFID